MLDHVVARTHHSRRGALKNAFTYGVDFVLTDLGPDWPGLISCNRFNLWSIHDRDFGGPRGQGRGVAWFREVLAERGFLDDSAQLLLLAQPACLWFQFNPVNFWIAMIDGTPRAFVAEVNSTFGQRHCYFCAHDDFRPITRSDQMAAEKMMHVSPFQKIQGTYLFNFGVTSDAINIRISYENGDQGVLATLSGKRQTASNWSLLRAALRRPLGAARVVALIHWQAGILTLKKAPFLRRQPAPELLISEGSRHRDPTG
ncbi:DUF1365 domain-containing protein [Sedimentitalea todarodis]|uniref:DUF1365 domain-containing protein n=1 Tax=Sedimentitalea todarodis TaxID=1631240 RepID=A0ABU3VGQ1_9RHOB|nr:DUF1365 domain-containing protein [Sedimentitalea todarodis]MDU9005361.1 DUF1365 domain-containing protein [Sedimentitalea todarodis]